MKQMKKSFLAIIILLLFLSFFVFLYIFYNLYSEKNGHNINLTTKASKISPVDQKSINEKWDLWSNGTLLRGANIYQRRVYLELDGPEFMGPGKVGPPYFQKDFDEMSKMGANYVNISHPGLFKENYPYGLDKNIEKNLDKLLAMIEKADMFAVISFRTGPGRSEFTFFIGDEGDWFDKSYYNENVWKDQEVQDKWTEMWKYTANRYKENRIVAGYDLMVEPNSNEAIDLIYEPEEFYKKYKNTLADWNIFHSRITKAIREVDSETPILIGGLGYSDINWLPYLKTSSDEHSVYIFHQYLPYDYTHQELPAKYKYPGKYDFNEDGKKENFNQDWFLDLMSNIDDFREKNKRPIACNEFGLARWIPGADKFMNDQMSSFENKGINYALWLWDTSWEPYAENDSFNFRHGPDQKNHKDLKTSNLIETIKKYWQKNYIRPSQVDI